MADGPAVETPSGKSAATENFPVGSILIERRLRPHVAAFYAFARAIDDIADSPELSADEKLERLDGFEQTLQGQEAGPGYGKAEVLAASLSVTGVSTRHGCDLVAAFRQDAVKNRYDDWDDLMAYCRLSAAPVGRYLIDLHGVSPDAYVASDALCASLQVINHLQDCGEDFCDLDRVYLPQDWMAEAGADTNDLGAGRASPRLRRVIDRCLEGCRSLMRETGALRSVRESRRLALESAVIIEIANRLIALLAVRDPLASRVKLSKLALVVAAGHGVVRTIAARA